MASVKLQGVPTMVWGVGGLDANGNSGLGNTFNGQIIESVSVKPVNGAPIEVEADQGFTKAAVFLDNGFDADVRLTIDGSKTYPTTMGTKVVIKLPSLANVNSHLTANWASYNCMLRSALPFDLSRKKEGMVTVPVMYRPDIDPNT